MLAGFGGAYGVLHVHGVGKADVDGVDGFVVADVVVGVVGVDGGFVNTVEFAVLGTFFGGVTGDEAGDFGVLGVLDLLHEGVGDVAEADRGVADAPGFFGASVGGQLGGGEGEGGKFGEVAAVHAGRVIRASNRVESIVIVSWYARQGEGLV